MKKILILVRFWMLFSMLFSLMFSLLFFLVCSCGPADRYEVPPLECKLPDLKRTNSLSQLYDFYTYGNYTFTEERIVSGYLISNDASGNIYKTLYLQDSPSAPSTGIQVAVGQTHLHTKYPVGVEIYIQLKGLTLGYRFGSLQLGKLIDGRLSPIPEFEMDSHLFRVCETVSLTPITVRLDSDISSYKNMLVRLDNVQFEVGEGTETYGEIGDNSTVERNLYQFSNSCNYVGSLPLRTSGFSNFKELALPQNKGLLTGIVTSYYDAYYLIVRDTLDVVFNQKPCIQVSHMQPTVSFATLYDRHQGTVVEFGDAEQLLLECFVISSDSEGNFTHELYVQDALENPKFGLRVLHKETDLYERYQPGDRLLLRLNRLYFDQVQGIMTLGYASESSVTYIEEGALQQHLLVLEKGAALIPHSLNLSTQKLAGNLHTLIRLEGVQLIPSERGKAFAFYSGELPATRTLEDCEGLQKGYLYTEGTASFASSKFPIQRVSLTGVLYRNDNVLHIKLRTPKDVEVLGGILECQRQSPKVMLTEIADPANNSKARFVELYNATEVAVSLDYWTLRKYTNASSNYTEVDLSGYTLEPDSFLVLGNLETTTYYNTVPWLISSLVLGNGDDAYELVDGEGTVKDVYGQPLQDGTGALWEYTDGKAVRKLEIQEPNAIFTIEEWELYSKTLGTSQFVPSDFSPHQR